MILLKAKADNLLKTNANNIPYQLEKESYDF